MDNDLNTLLVSPKDGSPLQREGDELRGEGGERYPVRNGIPRFIDTPDYAESFGDQWNRYRRVQLDSATGKPLSRTRLFEGTGWDPADLEGELILEAGCGAGRFTEVLLDSGARLVSVDASSAVDACRVTCGDATNVEIVQADLHALPFRPGSFDRVFCYGVLQCTPDPEQSFRALVDQVRPGGILAVDTYPRYKWIDRWSAKYLWRPLTTRIPHQVLRRILEWYIPRWLPIDTRLARVPKLGRFLVAIIPCWNYTGIFDLTKDELVAWAILDTFDALAPKYDRPQTLESVRGWCERAGLVDVDVHYGGNGIIVNARRPSAD
jgi:SAM-dependent methyltransferase